MAFAPALTIAPLADSRPWRLFVQALLAAAAALALGCAIYLLEKFLFAPRHRFVENPAEFMMRSLGTAHFLIGWLFLATSPRLRGRSALARLGGWAAVGVLLCLVFAWGGGAKNKFLLVAFY